MIKYMNAAQMRVLSSALADIWEKLQNYGHLQGGGPFQERNGEVILIATYVSGSMTGTPPETINGFRIKVEEKGRPYC